MSFSDAITHIYTRHEAHILPFIGGAYHSAASDDFRVVAVGINSYVAKTDWKPAAEMAGWFSGWFERGQHRFFPRAYRDSITLATALVSQSDLFRALKTRGKDSFYVTNAIKEYLTASEGKRAEQLVAEHFRRHIDQWHTELDAMAEHGVLPHLIVIFGKPFWEIAYRTFQRWQDHRFEHLTIKRYDWTEGTSRHYINRIEAEGAAGIQAVLLVRCAHPSARTKKGRPAWLLDQPDFRRLAGLPAAS